MDNPSNIEVCGPNHSNTIPSLPLKHLASTPTAIVESWYTNPTGVRLACLENVFSVAALLIPPRISDEIISNAYNKAKANFSNELTKDEFKRIWLREKASMADVVGAFTDLKQKYENKPESKARKWLVIFFEKITYYGAILDVLVQQYPEYASLAWGTMKFFVHCQCIHSFPL